MFSKIYKKYVCAFSILLIPIMFFTFFLNIVMPDTYYISSESDLKFSSYYGNFLSFDCGIFSGKSQIKLCNAIPVKNVNIESLNNDEVIVCGTPFGVKMFTEGVMVVDFDNISAMSTTSCPASSAGICIGDVICSINGNTVFTNEDVEKYIQESNGKSININIIRNSENMNLCVKPIKSKNDNKYKIGIWVRDSSAGIGTLTFYDPSTMVFAGLGHAICDIDTGQILPLSTGEIVSAAINSVKKGKSGNPGELEGIFLDSSPIGKLFVNNETGLYGTLNMEITGIPFQVAPKQDICEGPATILTTIDGTNTKEYSISIEKISMIENNATKNMIIKVTDKELIEKTGGIVQGMSGSPIIQNGKLVGAVTHVFVNDPTKGYAIFAENMKSVSSTVK